MIRRLKRLFDRLARHRPALSSATTLSAPPTPAVRNAPIVTDWDVGQAAETPEPGRVAYQFLGVTGEEES